jgi:hypothetical protein
MRSGDARLEANPLTWIKAKARRNGATAQPRDEGRA